MTKKPTVHRMSRRSLENDYSEPGMYHITLHADEGTGQPFGSVAGDASVADGCAGAPYVALTAVGRMVEHELTHSIAAHYPMVEVQTYVVMPEHLHFILEVHEAIVSRQGRKAHLGQVIAGFKKGCNRQYWELTGQGGEDGGFQRGKPAGTDLGGEASGEGGGCGASGASGCGESGGAIGAIGASGAGGGSCPAVYPQGYKVPSRGTSGRKPLFAPGYVDVMPLKEGQLKVQREYIRQNPRSRLLRTIHRDLLQPQRGGIDTALTVKALMGYLERECAPWQLTADMRAKIISRLLTTDGEEARRTGGENPPARTERVECHSYGERRLLGRRLLPVVCHRKDAKLFEQQEERCLKAAEEGAVLVSARIAKGEHKIMDKAQEQGRPVVLVIDNGMPELYHPSANRLEQCMNGKLLLVTPWRYHYRTTEDDISVAECKTMNCLVQALCRTKDSWWKAGILPLCLFTLFILTGCSLIDEDRSHCDDESAVSYEMELVTNIETEIATQLETQLPTQTAVDEAADVELAHEVREYLSGIFTDFAHDVNLSFYDTKGDSTRLYNDRHIMDGSQASYTLNLPRRHYMHLAIANLEKNEWVSLWNGDRCHKAMLDHAIGDTIDSHTAGLFTARAPMYMVEGIDQSFFVRLYMANCAACLVIDTRGHDTSGMQVFSTGFATGFSICDSVYHFAARPPMVRTHRMDTSLKNRVAFCSVNFPSKQGATRSVIETTEPFVTKNARESLWEFCVVVPQKDGKLTRTLVHVWQPLMPGQFKIVRVWLNADGSLSTDASEVSTSVQLDWKEGLVIEV